MCGILGFNWRDPELAKKLGDLIQSRGPDQDGYYIDDSITLGHRRLSIIDLSEKGRQPMYNEDKNVVIVFNGEIYNYQDIKKDLLSKKHVFYSLTDTEVIIHAYEEYGEKCLDLFNGQFAFCILDKRKNELFLARDRIGINPLFYYVKEDKFIFGSELKVILEAGIVKEINETALNFSLLFGWPHHKECIIKNAFKIEPGHYLVYDLNKKEIKTYRKYWEVLFSPEIKDEIKAKELILSKLEESVKLRMVADVPVGAFLSGGVDSSTVVAIMQKFTSNLNTFSVKFDHEEYDESKYAKLVSNLFHTNHHEIVLHGNEILDLIPKLVFHYDEPFGDSSMIPTFVVSKYAHEYVTVSLSGDGGDELFGGYENYTLLMQTYFHSKISRLFAITVRFLMEKFPRVRDSLSKFKSISGILDTVFILSQSQSRQFAYLNFNRYMKYLRRAKWKIPDFYKKYFVYRDFLSNAMNSDLHHYLPDDILTKVDRASLANSLESRPPFLDHELIELACRIDPNLKINRNVGKYILKRAIGNLLPKEIIYRRKKGFSVPLKYYLRKELRNLIVEKVQEYKGHNYFTHIDTKRLVQDHFNGTDNTALIWNLLMFNMWWERWMINQDNK